MPTLTLEQVMSGSDIYLDWGLSDLLMVELSGRKVLYGLSRIDGTLVELTVDQFGAVTFEDSISLNGSFQVGMVPSLAWIDGRILLSAKSAEDQHLVEISATGNLSSLSGDDTVGTVLAASSEGGYVVAISQSGNEVNSFSYDGQGYDLMGTILDSSEAYLAGLSDIHAFSVGTTPFAAVTSSVEAGVSILELGGSGELTISAEFGTLDGLPVSAPTSLEVLQHFGRTHILVASQGSSSLSSLELSETEELQIKDHILDDSGSYISGASTTSSVVVNDFAFLAAGGSEAGVSLFTVLPNGEIFHLASFADTETTTIFRPTALSLSSGEDILNLVIGSSWEAGLTRLTYDLSTLGAVLVASEGSAVGTFGDDQIVGSDVGDTISGQGGDDIIFDGHGSDFLTGGVGEDTFIFAADGQPDTILDFQLGVDRLDLSRFDFLNDVSQLEITTTADGAVISFADEDIIVRTDDNSQLSSADFTNANTFNADRPPLLQVNQLLNGAGNNDVLIGGSGNDTISGFAGADELSGGAGLDLLIGAGGADTLRGGGGDDVLQGGSEADLLIGGTDSDYIEGGIGGDLIYGDEIL